MENNYHNRPKYRKKMIAGRSAVVVTALLLLLGIRYTESVKNLKRDAYCTQLYIMDTTYMREDEMHMRQRMQQAQTAAKQENTTEKPAQASSTKPFQSTLGTATHSASKPWSQWSRRDKEHYLQTYVNRTRGDAFQLYYPIGLEIRDLPDSKIKAFYCPEQEKIIVNKKYLNQESVIRAVYLAMKHASLYHSNLHDL